MTANIQDVLSKKSKRELQSLAKQLRVNGFSSLSKADLVVRLVEQPGVASALNPTWWARYHNHVYGVATFIGLAAAIIPFCIDSPEPNDHSRANGLLAAKDETAKDTTSSSESSEDRQDASFEIAAVSVAEKCLWSGLKKDTSRDREAAKQVGFPFPGWEKQYPLYSGQVSINHVPPEMREEVNKTYSLDPVFDFSIINNSKDTVLIREIRLVVDEAFTLPAHMPTGGELKVQNTFTIQIEPFSSAPAAFLADLKNPIALSPKAPYRCEILLKDLSRNSHHNEIVVRFVFETNRGEVSSKQINLSMV